MAFGAGRYAVLPVVAALALALLQIPSASYACGPRIDLAVIDKAMTQPDLAADVATEARRLRAGAAKAIEEGHPEEGRRLYFRLMTLLDIPIYASSTLKARC